MATGDDNKFLQVLYPTNEREMEDAEDMNTKIGFLQELKYHIGELEEQKDQVEAEIKERIGLSKGIQTSQYIVTWTPQQRSCVDTVKLKEDGLYEKYSAIKRSRVMRVKLNKKEK